MGVSAWQIEGYDLLRQRILERAVLDYRNALKNSEIQGKKCSKEKELEGFFLSPWGQTLSENNGQYIIDRIRAEKRSKNDAALSGVPVEEQIKIVDDYKNGMTPIEVYAKYKINRRQLAVFLRKWG